MVIYYLFYIAIGEKIIIKTCPCLLLFQCSCVNKQIIQSFTCIFKIVFEWSGGGTAGFCLEPRRWVTEQKKDGEKGGPWRMFNSPAKWSGTHVRQVWLGTFFLGKLNCLVSWKRDLILQCLSQRFCSYFTYKFKWKMSYFSLRHFSVLTAKG